MKIQISKNYNILDVLDEIREMMESLPEYQFSHNDMLINLELQSDDGTLSPDNDKTISFTKPITEKDRRAAADKKFFAHWKNLINNKKSYVALDSEKTDCDVYVTLEKSREIHICNTNSSENELKRTFQLDMSIGNGDYVKTYVKFNDTDKEYDRDTAASFSDGTFMQTILFLQLDGTTIWTDGVRIKEGFPVGFSDSDKTKIRTILSRINNE